MMMHFQTDTLHDIVFVVNNRKGFNRLHKPACGCEAAINTNSVPQVNPKYPDRHFGFSKAAAL